MKTAVSIPDSVFKRVEELARSTKRSRSRIVREALDEYLARHVNTEITDAMNASLQDAADGSDSFVTAAAPLLLRDQDW